ncbi:heavy metal translocating P-type ATPase [Tessaracoccus palaemonis]|uniref:Cadmium-translocating P-type ATPase n=1 Tax=Tessaracoccus palaemonis TaxID=2829499 RepID=A0ABX8SMM2_9ACTN|nr:cation-translocating P-type ATPase [Tessaracoccus palaemonis]QXT63298.1 cadmium-translocating P-type ATPase [Tessaracoccus palaemonis]
MTATREAADEAVEATGAASLWRRVDRGDAARAAFVAVCTLVTALGLTWPWPAAPAVAVLGIVIGCWPILTEAVEDVRHRRMSMELSMLIAIVAAALIGEWTTALLIATFVLAAEILEDLSMDRGRDALTDLMTFLPETVRVRTGDGAVEIPLVDVRVGQVLVVAPGGRVPVDGVVVAGTSSLDQSRITGESLPVDVGPGAEVYAGSINQVGAVEISAVRVGAESSYGRIVEAVRHAQASEPPVQRLADRLAAWLVYLALGGAALTFLVTRDLTATISVVVVAGACGVAAGTPLAVLAAIARVARSGAFVKDGAHLEALSVVDTVVFDKTGTLTTGNPAVVGIRSTGLPEDELLRLAAGAELYSEHPLGRAIVAEARARGVALPAVADFEYRPGLGVTAVVEGATVAAGGASLVPDAPAADGVATAVHVAVAGSYAGTILLADPVRPSARAAVAELHRRGLRTLMITGDQEGPARAVADELGIGEVRAGLLPEKKLAAIDAERAAGHRLAMVGDGVNDAPALARADVGIAMGSGTDIARDSADVVLISSDPADLVRTVQVARRARRIVLVNFAGTIAVDLVGMLLAAFGILGPVAAALVHVGSETAFILNSARLIPGRGSRRA